MARMEFLFRWLLWVKNTTCVIFQSLINDQRSIIKRLESLMATCENNIETNTYDLKLHRESIKDSLNIIETLNEGMKEYDK